MHINYFPINLEKIHNVPSSLKDKGIETWMMGTNLLLGANCDIVWEVHLNWIQTWEKQIQTWFYHFLTV